MTDFNTFDINRYIQSNQLRGWDRTYGTKGDMFKLTQLVSRSEFPDFITEVVLEGMEEVMAVELVADRLFHKFSESSPVISWLEEHGFDAQVLAEGEAPMNARIRHSKKTFRSVKFGLGLEFTHEALRDIDKMDTLGRHLRRVSRAIAFRENQYLLSVAFNGVADGSDPHKTGDVYSNHVLSATDVTWTANSGIMDIEKMQVTEQIFAEEGFDFNLMAVHPATYTAMLGLEEFRSSNVITYLSPQSEAIIENKSKTPYFLPNGVEVLVNREMPSGYALFLDKNEFGGYYEIEGLTTVQLPEDLARMTKMGFYKESGAVAMKPQAAVMMKDLTSKDPSSYVTSA